MVLKKTHLLVGLLLGFLFAGRAFPQSGSEHSLTELNAGNIRAGFFLSASPSAWGFSNERFSGKPGTSTVSGNPAGLFLYAKREIRLEAGPAVRLNAKKVMDIDGRIRREMDDVLSRYGTAGSTVVYPRVDPRAGFETGLTGFSFSFPFRLSGRSFGAGLGWFSPLSLKFRATGTGIETGIESVQDIQGELKRIRMRTRVTADAQASLRLNRIVFGAGSDLGKGWALGLSLQRHEASGSAVATAGLDGIVEISGTEYMFNDPFDPRIDFEAGEQNDINQFFQADYRGSGWGFKLGAVRQASDRLTWDLELQSSVRIRATGTDSTVNNRVPFIKTDGAGSGGDVGDMIDPTAIDLAKLTSTERFVQVDAFDPELEIPGHAGLGCLWTKGRTQLDFRFALHWGRLGVRAGKEQEILFKPSFSLGMGACFNRFFFKGSATRGSIRSGGKRPVSFWIPSAGIGYRIPVTPSCNADALIGLCPLPVLQAVVHFEF
ncbi:hypothetical protein JW906_15810 [bacterium]|nr:hypothetical protein [bacterium]